MWRFFAKHCGDYSKLNKLPSITQFKGAFGFLTDFTLLAVNLCFHRSSVLNVYRATCRWLYYKGYLHNTWQENIWKVSQACTTYGPRAAWGPLKLFLRPARTFSVAENGAKARPQVIIVPEFLQYYNEISTWRWNRLVRPAGKLRW